MARTINRLSDKSVQAKKAKGFYPDGGGLYLQINGATSKSWVFRFKRAGRAWDMGLGSLTHVSLAEARSRAAEARRQRSEGRDPIAETPTGAGAHCSGPLLHLQGLRGTANRLARGWVAERQAQDPVAKHPSHLRLSRPGHGAGCDVSTDLVLKVLEPIWATKTETASDCADASRQCSHGPRRGKCAMARIGGVAWPP